MRRNWALLIVVGWMLCMVPGTFAQAEEIIIAEYEVLLDGSLEFLSGDPNPLHEDLWIDVITLLPTEWVDEYIYYFTVFESEDTYAYVDEIFDGEWEFAINVEDSDEFAITILHEFAHIVTLNDAEYVNYDVVLDDREGLIETDAAYEDGIAEGMAVCDTFAYDDGCPVDDSLLVLWTEEFWLDDYELAFDGSLDDPAIFFFDEDPDAFVSEYAATYPADDFAVTFSIFVALEDDELPTMDSDRIVEQKIAWFSTIPELADLRDDLRTAAAANGIAFYIPEDYNY